MMVSPEGAAFAVILMVISVGGFCYTLIGAVVDYLEKHGDY
jgi:hypothetical protein